jgi:hypothetical protein
MVILRKKLRNLGHAARILTIIGILIFLSLSCKSPFAPSGGEADIIVYNEYGETLDVYMDGEFRFAISNKANIEIDNVSLKEHELEAKERNTGIIIATETINVEEKVDYTWTIDDPPDICVTNNYGETLKIYMDGNYQFDLADEEDRWVIDVEYGERFLKAIKASNNKEVASITIHADENKDYFWTIE